MIHHVSIPARKPQHVAEVLAELMNGRCFPFGPVEGAFMAASGDANGTLFEVYPEDVPENTQTALRIAVDGRRRHACGGAMPSSPCRRRTRSPQSSFDQLRHGLLKARCASRFFKSRA